MMLYSLLVSASTIVMAATFSNTIGLGSVVVGLLIVIGFAWASRKDKRSERWEKLYDLADTERKEVQSSLDEATKVVLDQKEVIQKLDALQMPIRIVELMNDSVARIDTAARTRLEEALGDVHARFTTSEDRAQQRADAAEARAQERHEVQMELLHKLVDRVLEARG